MLIVKITNVIIVSTLFYLPVLAQNSDRTFGWDLTYAAVLKANKIGSATYIRKWLAKDYRSPAKKWITGTQGEPIVSSILIEYASFAHAGEHTTMWLFRTEDRAYYRQEIEDVNFSDIQKELAPAVYDNFFSTVSSWRQAKPLKPANGSPQSIPGYLGFLSLYDKGRSRQMLLSEEDFTACQTKQCRGAKPGRLLLALEPITPKYEKR